MEREMAELKLVLHVDQADHWPAAFGNLNNLTRDYPDAEIRVVANGAGIYAFVGQSDLREKFDQFAANGVTFQVCHNALKEHHVEPTALPDFANVVPAGVVALAEAQRDGFAYIKP
jgi:intracellular sulfur oxidation DsrE/DsrF family protein